MPLLLLFAFLSGLVTIAAPCIWPLLPIVLSSSATGGRKKALGISLGVITSFTIFTLAISYLVKILPISADSFRLLSVVIIAFLGLTLIIPALSAKVEGLVSSFGSRFGKKTNSGSGFGVGFITGLSLGIVWSPCAGPILATIATLASTRAVSGQVILVTLSYSLGVGIPLFIFALLGSKVFQKSRFLSQYTGVIQRIFGIIMIATALLIFTNNDKVLEANLLNAFPALSGFAGNFEQGSQITGQLQALKNNPGVQFSGSQAPDASGKLPVISKATDFVGINKWLNLPDGKQSLTMADLKGKVVLVDFWTYTCINCIRTLPFVTSWYDKYKDQGFVVVGVHTPEFEFEKETPNVMNAIKQYNIHYPVAQDNDYKTWNNFSNEYWPAEYLIDSDGNVRRTHFGEGEYDQTEQAIQSLLKERGAKITQSLTNMKDQTPTDDISPETYLGTERMEFYYPDGKVGTGAQNFTLKDDIPVNSFSFGGSWNINESYAVTTQNSVLNYHFLADKVFLVARPGQGNQTAQVKVTIDGKDVDASNAGDDLKNGVLTIDSDRLYTLVNLHGKTEDHTLKLQFLTPNTEPYVFTFG